MAANAWVIAGGDFQPEDLNRARIAKTDLIVGVDFGIAHCLAAGVVPDVMIGDFDSIDKAVLEDPRLANAQIIRHPPRKDRSDLELALDWLTLKPVKRVSLLGISGGRTDHHMFNWLLPFQTHWSFAIEMIDASVHAHLVSAQYPLHVKAQIGQTISILPVPEANGVTTAGLEYALEQARLDAGSTLGLSNVAAADSIGVSVLSGRALVFRVKPGKVDSNSES